MNKSKKAIQNQKGRTSGKSKYRGGSGGKQQRRNVKDIVGNREVQDDRSDHDYNDVVWYKRTPQLLQDAANLSFNSQVGMKIDLHFPTTISNVAGNSPTFNIVGQELSIPGVMGIFYLPHFGVAEDHTDALNLAAANVYSYVRHANSGATNYDRTDLMLMLICVDSIFQISTWMQRLYGIINTYSGFNRYMPKALCYALGVDYEDMLNHINDLRAFVNVYNTRAKSLWVPKELPVFIRHSWLTSNVYKDADDDQAQLYITVPIGFYKYIEQDGSGYAEFKQFGISQDTMGSNGQPYESITGFLKFADITSYANELMNAVLDSEDIGIMCGDILKAYGESNLFTLSTIDESYRIDPTFNPEFMTQIENGFCVQHSYTGASNQFNITQDVDRNLLICKPTVYQPYSINFHKLVNFHRISPTPDDIMIATRFSISVKSESYTYTGGRPPVAVELSSAGTELLTGYRIYYMDYNSAKKWDVCATAPFGSLMITGTATGNVGIKSAAVAESVFAKLSKFDYAPLIYKFNMQAEGTGASTEFDLQYYGVYGDIDVVAPVPDDTIYNMNTVAVLSELGVPI